MKLKIAGLTVLALVTSLSLRGQYHLLNNRLGVNIGLGTQMFIPFNSTHYEYRPKFIKAGYSKIYFNKKKVFADVLIELGYYRSHHRLLNEFFLGPSRGPDYKEKTVLFMQERSINEYVLNIGTRWHYKLYNQASVYAFVSIGPMYMDKETERLAKGFAFSDIGGIGFLIDLGSLVFDIRSTIRHVSNANLQDPNSGHNSSHVEIGISFPLVSKKGAGNQ